MSKTWTHEDHNFALDAAWTAFFSTLRAHGVTTKEIKGLRGMAESAIYKVSDYFGQTITWEQE